MTSRGVSAIVRRAPYVLLLMRHGVTPSCFKPISIQALAQELGTTCQNVSKILSRLERDGLIVRIVRPQLMVKFTDRASDVISFILSCIREYISDITTIRLIGQVFSGLGEGRYYMMLEGYRRQFIEKLGFDPYPGTLNVRLKDEHVRYKYYLMKLPGIYIHGFEDGGRTYGGVKSFRAVVRANGVELKPCAVLLIERTHHDFNVIEVISSYRIRDALKVSDGDEIEIIVHI